MNKQPTEAQIKEFWEWCGWGYMPGLGLISPEGEDYVPPIDLNNLFKYAMPKLLDIKNRWDSISSDGLWLRLDLISGSGEYSVEIRTWSNHLVYETPQKEIGTDPALALFWAIWQVKEIK